MCMFKMKKKVTKDKRTPEEEKEAVTTLIKKWRESSAGQSITRLMQYQNKTMWV